MGSQVEVGPRVSLIDPSTEPHVLFHFGSVSIQHFLNSSILAVLHTPKPWSRRPFDSPPLRPGDFSILHWKRLNSVDTEFQRIPSSFLIFTPSITIRTFGETRRNSDQRGSCQKMGRLWRGTSPCSHFLLGNVFALEKLWLVTKSTYSWPTSCPNIKFFLIQPTPSPLSYQLEPFHWKPSHTQSFSKTGYSDIGVIQFDKLCDGCP